MKALQIGMCKIFEGNTYQVTGLAVHTETEERFAVYKPASKVSLSPDNCLARPLELAQRDEGGRGCTDLFDAETDIVLGRYEHFKSTPEEPKFYTVTGVGRHTETAERLVVYTPLYEVDLGPNTCLVRPLEMFFEDVTREGVTRPRFRYVQS